jgi:catechol 2,3-dioxygenase-like lactoylglutathione lyase family enzyme
MSSYHHHHTHVTSQDVEKAVEFYTQVMKAEVKKVQGSGDRKMVDIDLGGVPVRISSSTGADNAWTGLRYGLHHLGLILNNMDEFAANLKANGVEFVVEPTQPRPGVKLAFIKAPDNVLFEIVELSEG